MDEKKFSLSAARSLAVPLADADALLSACDGTAALLYLYALRGGGGFTVSAAAAALRRTDAEIEKALQKLCELGVFSAGGEKSAPAPLPQPASNDPTGLPALDDKLPVDTEMPETLPELGQAPR